MLNKLIATVILALGLTAHAEEYRMIIPYAAGSQADVASRIIIKNFERITGDKIFIELAPGADSVIGINAFKNSKADLIFLGSGASIYAPVLKKDLPYDPDVDFDRILYVGTAPAVWFSRPGTAVKTPADLVTHLPQFVGTNASHGTANVAIVNREKNGNSETTLYKGSPETITAVIGGSIDLGIVNPTATMIELAKAGKITLIGSTYHEDIVIDGVPIPSVHRRTKIHQLNGSTEIAARPGMDPARLERLRQGLWAAVRDPDTQEKLRLIFIMPDATINQQWINNYTREIRERFRRYSR